MKSAYELFQVMKPETALSILQYLRDEQRDVYKATLNSVAANRKLRPVIVQRKSVAEQMAWILKNLRIRSAGEISTQVLQLWLLKGHTDLLNRFLDGLGIEHEDTGAADDLPDTLDAEKLESAITGLLKDFDPEIVSIYLHVFQGQKTGGWPELAEQIAKRPELQLGSDTAAAKTSDQAETKEASAAKVETTETASEASEDAEEAVS